MVRRAVGVASLLALLVIALGVSGFELQLPRFGAGGPERSLTGVRIAAATHLVRVGQQAPAGGELVFLAVEPSGNILATDRQRQSVVRFDATGHLLSEWGPRLARDTALDEPAGIAVSGERIVVVDRGVIPRLHVLDTTGQLIDTLSLDSLSTYGLNGATTDLDGNVYVADTGRNRLLAFSPQGSLIRQVSSGNSEVGDLKQPMALAFAPDASFFTADWENSRVVHFDAAAKAIRAWSPGFRPFGVAVDSSGRVYAPDSERRRILVYSPTGDQLAELGAAGTPAIEIPPRQLAFSPDQPLSLYVLAGQGIVRLELQDVAAAAPTEDDIDLLSPLLLLILVVVPVVALLSRRGRSARSAPVRKVGLEPVDSAQRQNQQPRGDQDLALAVAHQTDHQQQAADHHNDPIRDRKSDHRSRS